VAARALQRPSWRAHDHQKRAVAHLTGHDSSRRGARGLVDGRDLSPTQLGCGHVERQVLHHYAATEYRDAQACRAAGVRGGPVRMERGSASASADMFRS